MLPPSHSPRAKNLGAANLWAVLAEELSDPPAGHPRISCLLLSTRPVTGWEEACACLELYSRRRLIERYHYVLKRVLWKGWAKLETITDTWLRLQQNAHILRLPGTCG